MQAFLIPGALSIGFGLHEGSFISQRKTLIVLMILMLVVGALLFPYGGRGAMVQIFLLAAIVYERRVARLSRQWLMITALVLGIVSLGVLYLRFAEAPNQSVRFDIGTAQATSANVLNGDLNRFSSITYLADEVASTGTLNGKTP